MHYMCIYILSFLCCVVFNKGLPNIILTGQFPNRTIPRLKIFPIGQLLERHFPRLIFFLFNIIYIFSVYTVVDYIKRRFFAYRDL